VKNWQGPLEKISEYKWRIPSSYEAGMLQSGIIYTSDKMIDQVKGDMAPQQVANMAHLPGLAGPVLAMPDIHYGYGFPIGGVVAVDAEEGVISPGGVGYDINCGVRLLRTNLKAADITKEIKPLIEKLFLNIPCGVGGTGKLNLSNKDLKDVLRQGAGWAVENGFGQELDLINCEGGGRIEDADPDTLSDQALRRGKPQLGTLGSGNHFLEIQVVEEVYAPDAAEVFGLEYGQIVVMIHCGSRGLGYQVCDDNLVKMVRAMEKYNIVMPDRQLCCAPVQSNEGRHYLSAMAAAANYAWANRQLIMHEVRKVFNSHFGESAAGLGMSLLYDVAHNIAKFETHQIDNNSQKVLVHRKGATRAFCPGHTELPQRYQSVGQPVIIPGDMGTASYVLHGTRTAMEETYGSACHGAGRLMSRRAAIRNLKGRSMADEMEQRGIVVRSRGRNTLIEEAPDVYKDIHSIIEVVQGAGLAGKVVRLKPLGVIKG